MDAGATRRGGLGRRGFLRLCAVTAGAFVVPRRPDPIVQFPDAERLGRVCIAGKVDVKSRPDMDSATVDVLYEDAIVAWLRERVGNAPLRRNQRFVETERGYIWSPVLQPVRNRPNVPVDTLPETALGPGFWGEVTVPYVDVVVGNPPARSPYLRGALLPRLYYTQIVWIDQVKTDDAGRKLYRINERYGYGDLLWAAGEAFRPLTEEDWSPIRPEVEDKKVVVDLTGQTLACLEQGREVYFCRISSGAKFDAQGNPVDKWSTPIGPHPIWRKVFSLHMSGGTTGGGYDLPGIGWTCLFSGEGVSIHSTFWHNDFGETRSHGCVNASPADAQWVFRWTSPQVAAIPGDETVSMPGGTIVEVIES
jgi:L,D-transpeptidase catalytic domain